jgi:hypothetical protein
LEEREIKYRMKMEKYVFYIFFSLETFVFIKKIRRKNGVNKKKATKEEIKRLYSIRKRNLRITKQVIWLVE